MCLRKVVSSSIVAAFLFIVMGCVSYKPITEIAGITEIKYELDDPLTLQIDELYLLTCWYKLGESSTPDKWYHLMNWEGITTAVDKPCYSINGQRLRVNPDPFTLLTDTKAIVTIKTPGHSDIQTIRINTVPKKTSFTFNGDSGDDSILGSPGERGENGEDLDLEIAHYSTKGTQWESSGNLILVGERKSGRLWLIPEDSKALRFSSKGGSGGEGGSGRNRLKGADDPDILQQYGENGYPGGCGGDGGYVKAAFPSTSKLKGLFYCDVSGGNGGDGGDGGVGDYNGARGPDGFPGTRGVVAISEVPLDDMFIWVSSPLFERSRLLP